MCVCVCMHWDGSHLEDPRDWSGETRRGGGQLDLRLVCILLGSVSVCVDGSIFNWSPYTVYYKKSRLLDSYHRLLGWTDWQELKETHLYLLQTSATKKLGCCQLYVKSSQIASSWMILWCLAAQIIMSSSSLNVIKFLAIKRPKTKTSTNCEVHKPDTNSTLLDTSSYTSPFILNVLLL